MPGRKRDSQSKSIEGKKNGRATSGDRGGEPTVQVARPWLGDRRWVSGEEIVSARIGEANIVPRKSRNKYYPSPAIFFSFCDAGHLTVSNSATFPEKIASFAICDLSAGCNLTIQNISKMHPVDCVDRLHWGIPRHCVDRGDAFRRIHVSFRIAPEIPRSEFTMRTYPQ